MRAAVGVTSRVRGTEVAIGAGVSSSVWAASITDGGVIAVHDTRGGWASYLTSTACLFASGTLTAGVGRGIVAILTLDHRAEAIIHHGESRELSIDGGSEERHNSESFGNHFDIRYEVSGI